MVKSSSTHHHQPTKNIIRSTCMPTRRSRKEKKFSTPQRKTPDPSTEPQEPHREPQIWTPNSGRTGAPIRDANSGRQDVCAHVCTLCTRPRPRDTSLINSSFGTHWTPHFGPKFGTPQDPQFGTGWDPQFGTPQNTPEPRPQTPDPRPWPPNHHSTPQNHTELTETSHQTPGSSHQTTKIPQRNHRITPDLGGSLRPTLRPDLGPRKKPQSAYRFYTRNSTLNDFG